MSRSNDLFDASENADCGTILSRIGLSDSFSLTHFFDNYVSNWHWKLPGNSTTFLRTEQN